MLRGRSPRTVDRQKVSQPFGDHWTKLAADVFANSQIADIVVDPKNHRHLMAGTHGRGVVQSFDGGSTWQTRP